METLAATSQTLSGFHPQSRPQSPSPFSPKSLPFGRCSSLLGLFPPTSKATTSSQDGHERLRLHRARGGRTATTTAVCSTLSLAHLLHVWSRHNLSSLHPPKRRRSWAASTSSSTFLSLPPPTLLLGYQW